MHAGLEILRSELTTLTRDTLELASESIKLLIEDIYSSSETAIEILNDLLHYEHMDAGTFNLELCWRPLARLLEGKLHWAAILAEKKGVQLVVLDDTIASEFGIDSTGLLDSVSQSAQPHRLAGTSSIAGSDIESNPNPDRPSPSFL